MARQSHSGYAEAFLVAVSARQSTMITVLRLDHSRSIAFRRGDPTRAKQKRDYQQGDFIQRDSSARACCPPLFARTAGIAERAEETPTRHSPLPASALRLAITEDHLC